MGFRLDRRELYKWAWASVLCWVHGRRRTKMRHGNIPTTNQCVQTCMPWTPTDQCPTRNNSTSLVNVDAEDVELATHGSLVGWVCGGKGRRRAGEGAGGEGGTGEGARRRAKRQQSQRGGAAGGVEGRRGMGCRGAGVRREGEGEAGAGAKTREARRREVQRRWTDHRDAGAGGPRAHSSSQSDSAPLRSYPM